MEANSLTSRNDKIKTINYSPNSSSYLNTERNTNLNYNLNFNPRNTHFFTPRNRNRNFSTQIYSILSNDSNWAREMKLYREEKQNPNRGIKHPISKIITPNYVRTIETYFNPITQKYRDPKTEKKVEENDNKELINKISTNYDKELSITQTYDIINLKDKLKFFEKDKNYPKEKNKEYYSSKRNGSLQNYNILSNLSFREHHYDKPENRKNFPTDENIKLTNKSSKKMGRLSRVENPNFNIITNKYNFFDKEKKQVEDMCALQTAKNFLTKREYDIIKGVYYDPEKEKKYQENLSIENEKLRNGKRDSLFNPFTNVVYDEENLKIKDMLNKNAKLRYSLKYKIEKHYHQKDLKKFSKNNKKLDSKLFYDRFNSIDKRGYDILSNEINSNTYKNTINCLNKRSPWEIIQLGSDKKNETISTKGIYKSMYDKSDIESNSFEYKHEREKMLKKLPPPSEDKIFNTVKEVNRKLKTISSYRDSKKNLRSNIKKDFSIDKKTWFSKDKNVDMRNSK